MDFREKIRLFYVKLLGVIMFSDMLIIPIILSLTPLDIYSSGMNKHYMAGAAGRGWTYLGIFSLLSSPLPIKKENSYFFLISVWNLLKLGFCSYFTFLLVNKQPLWKAAMKNYYVKEYIRYADPFQVISRQVAIRNGSILFSIFYFMFCVSIICLLILHVVELILTITERE